MELSVIGFNIRSCNDPDGNSIPERAPRLAKILENYDADVVCLQEFTPKWEPFWELLTRGVYDRLHKYRNETVDIEGGPHPLEKGEIRLPANRLVLAFRYPRGGIPWLGSDLPLLSDLPLCDPS